MCSSDLDQRDPDVIVQRRIELAEQVGLITAFGQDIAEVCRDAKIDVDFPEGIQFRPANMPGIETPVARDDPDPVPFVGEQGRMYRLRAGRFPEENEILIRSAEKNSRNSAAKAAVLRIMNIALKTEILFIVSSA